MLNAFRNPQSVVLIGAGSEIGQQVLSNLNQTYLKRVLMASRDGEAKYQHFGESIKASYQTEKDRDELIGKIFAEGDIDIVIIAIGLLKGTVNEVININYVASVDLLYKTAQKMQLQGHGQILVISSFAQTRPRPENYLYGSSKAGLDFYARGLANEIVGSGVKITILRPGFVKTKMTAGMKSAPFWITAEEAGKIGALSLKKKKIVNYVPGKLRYVALVFQLLPQIFIEKLAK
jgi:decaprenylphospho-beta-D-erythro-pentofuranosid-2-ulose 2-reductase